MYYIGYFHIWNSYYIYQDYEYYLFSIKGYLSLIYSCISSLTFDIAFIWIGLENTISSTLIVALSLIILTKLKQINAILNQTHLNDYELRRFIRHHTKILLDILSGNHFIGVLIFVYLILVAPLNSYLMNGILRRNFNFGSQILFSSVIILQYDGIIALHLLASLYTKNIHKCIRKLFNLMANQNKRKFKFINQIKLMFYIEKYNIHKKYGM